MNKIEQIEHFLRLISEISKNDVLIDSNLVYSNLITLNTPKEDINRFFNLWVNRFNNNKDIDVFVQSNWKYFCQFVGFNSKTRDYSKIKIYVPLDKNHIYEGVNRLFDFISSNKIPHRSKVGSHTRFDDVVLRVDSKEDADKITNFINNDSYIQEGLIKASPFGFNDNNIAYAWDGYMSYNTVVSNWISDYINDLKSNDRLNYCSYTGFYTFIKEKYSDLFLKGIGINEFISTHNIKGSYGDSVENLLNYHDVTRLLLIALNPNSKLDNLYSSIKAYNNPEYQREMCLRFNKFIHNDKKEVISNEEKESIDYIFGKLYKKGGDEYAIKIYKKFIETGEYRLFTREDNIRGYILANNITKESVKERLIEYQEEALMKASAETVIKYGISQLKAAIISMKANDYKMFTNTNGVRDELKKYIKPNELDSVIKKVNIDNGIDARTLSESYDSFANIVSSNFRRVK